MGRNAGKEEELLRKRQEVLLGGGERATAKQHALGKRTARERLQILLDAGSFVELGEFVNHRCTQFGMEKVNSPGDGVVTGYGTVGGRRVFVYAQDFTVMGGTLGEMHAAKICKVFDLATKTGAPMIGINDSGGARIQEGIDALNGYGEIFKRNTLASGVIPQFSLILGPCAGGAVYSPALTDFVFMVERTGHMFITGPQVIKAITGEEIDPESLGGSKVHSRLSGVAHFSSPSEEECFHLFQSLLSYLPQNNAEYPPEITCQDPVDRETGEVLNILPDEPSQPYDVRDILHSILDQGSFLEVQAGFAPNVVTGYGRLNGRVVGVTANQPQALAGCLDINASDKAARHIRFCDAFNIPLLTLVDTPGYMPGMKQEKDGIIRHGAKLLFAFAEANVPKITLILRKAYGGAYLAMCSSSLGADEVLAWPTAEIAVMGPEGAAQVVFAEEIARDPDPERKRAEKISEYRDRFSNPYLAAGRGLVHRVIEPHTTRRALIQAMENMAGKREGRPAKKHGNIPL